MQTVNNMGFDLFEVQDLIEEKGIAENKVDLLCDLIQRKNYYNVLKVQKPKPM